MFHFLFKTFVIRPAYQGLAILSFTCYSSSLSVCTDGRERSVGLSFLSSLTRKSRLAAVGFVHMGDDGKMPPRTLLKAGVPAVPDVLTGFI